MTSSLWVFGFTSFLTVKFKHTGGKMSHIDRLRDRLDVIELLNLAKQYLTYKELSRILSTEQTVLARYIKGHVLPSPERSDQLRAVLMDVLKASSDISNRLGEAGAGAVLQANRNPFLLSFIARDTIHVNAGKSVTKVLTLLGTAVPLATLVSQRLYVPLAIADTSKFMTSESYIESVIPSANLHVETLYFPKRELKKTDNVLIITDILSDGATQIALEGIVRKANAVTTALYAIIALGDQWKTAFEEGKIVCPVKSFTQGTVLTNQTLQPKQVLSELTPESVLSR